MTENTKILISRAEKFLADRPITYTGPPTKSVHRDVRDLLLELIQDLKEWEDSCSFCRSIMKNGINYQGEQFKYSCQKCGKEYTNSDEVEGKAIEITTETIMPIGGFFCPTCFHQELREMNPPDQGGKSE